MGMGISSTLDSYYYCNNYFNNNVYYIEVKNGNKNNSFNYINNIYFMDFKNNVKDLNMIEEYIKKYATKHKISIDEAKEHAIVKFVIQFYKQRYSI